MDLSYKLYYTLKSILCLGGSDPQSGSWYRPSWNQLKSLLVLTSVPSTTLLSFSFPTVVSVYGSTGLAHFMLLLIAMQGHFCELRLSRLGKVGEAAARFSFKCM